MAPLLLWAGPCGTSDGSHGRAEPALQNARPVPPDCWGDSNLSCYWRFRLELLRFASSVRTPGRFHANRHRAACACSHRFLVCNACVRQRAGTEPIAIEGEEGLSRLFRYTLTLATPNSRAKQRASGGQCRHQAVDRRDAHHAHRSGWQARLRSEQRHISGLVTRVRFLRLENRRALYEAVVELLAHSGNAHERLPHLPERRRAGHRQDCSRQVRLALRDTGHAKLSGS